MLPALILPYKSTPKNSVMYSTGAQSDWSIKQMSASLEVYFCDGYVH